MSRNIFSVLILFIFNNLVFGQKTETIRGFSREYFDFQGRAAWLMKPKVSAIGNPWVWRAHFPDWHTETDSILLERGFHVAYVNTNDMFGSPASMQIWDDFYNFLVSER